MALSERLAILITANPENAVKGFEKVGKAAEKNLGKAQSSSQKFGATLTKVGAGMAAFGGVALVGLGKLAEESQKDTLATLKLQNSLKNSPTITNKSTKAYLELADAIQSKTSVANEDIVSGEAVLAQMGLTAAQVKTLTPFVADLAVKFGKDMPTAAKSVAKAVNGSAGALGKMGIVLDKTALKTNAYKTVQDALAHSVGGFAEAQGKTFTGQLQRMKNELQDLEEGVGKGAVGAFTNLFSVVDKGSRSLSGLSGSTQATIGEFATYGSVALVAVGGTSALIGMLIKAKANFGIAATSVKTFAGHLKNEAAFARESAAATSALGAVTGGVLVAGVAAGVFMLGKLIERSKAGAKAADALRSEVEGSGKSLKDTFLKNLNELAAGVDGTFSKALGDLGPKFGNISKDAGVGLTDLAKGLSGSDAQFKKFRDSAEHSLIVMDKSSSRGAAFADALNILRTAFTDSASAQDALAAGADALGIANDKNASTTDTATQKANAYKDAMDALSQAQDRYLGKTLSMDEATANFQKSINDEAQAVKDAGGHFNDATNKSIDFNAAQRDIVNNAAGVIKGLQDTGVASADVSRRQKELANQYYLTAIANHVPAAVAAKYRDIILGIPTNRTTVFHAIVDDAGALARLNELAQRLASVGNSGGFGRVSAQFVRANATGHATGGNLTEGWNVVGERGPEIIRKTGTKAHVFTNAQSRAMGGGSVVVNNVFHITESTSPQATAAAVQRVFRNERALAGAVSIGE